MALPPRLLPPGKSRLPGGAAALDGLRVLTLHVLTWICISERSIRPVNDVSRRTPARTSASSAADSGSGALSRPMPTAASKPQSSLLSNHSCPIL